LIKGKAVKTASGGNRMSKKNAPAKKNAVVKEKKTSAWEKGKGGGKNRSTPRYSGEKGEIKR